MNKGRHRSRRSPRALVVAVVAAAATLAATAPASAETIAGTFAYSDTGGATKPIVGAPVEISRGVRGLFGNWYWNTVAMPKTDDGGAFSVYVPHKAKGAKYRLRIMASNGAATAREGLGVFSRTVTMPQTVEAWDDVLTLDTMFTDGAAASRFNLIETIRHGFAYAQANRDPNESDRIPNASVEITPAGSLLPPTWYDPMWDTVRIAEADAFEDFLILHEYAHFLEEQISSFPWIPSIHDGCTAKDAFGNVINSSEHAWMEGFADYFAQVVASLKPEAGLAGRHGHGTPSALRLEHQPEACDLMIGGSGIEIFVAGSLWDVFDKSTDLDSAESHDTLERLDSQVFQIVDRELDVYGTGPTMYWFRHAWWGRGLSSESLDRIVGHHRIAGPFLPTPRPPADPGGGEDPSECFPVKICEP